MIHNENENKMRIPLSTANNDNRKEDESPLLSSSLDNFFITIILSSQYNVAVAVQCINICPRIVVVY